MSRAERIVLHVVVLAALLGATAFAFTRALAAPGGAWDVALGGLVLGTIATHVHLLAGGAAAWRVAGAVVVRSWRAILSYRFQVVMVFVQLAVFGALVILLGRPIIDLLFGPVGVAMEGATTTNFVVFLLLGLSLLPVLVGAFEVSAARLRQEQMTGMYEALVPTPAGVMTLPFAYLVSALSNTLLSMTGVLIVFSIILPTGAIAVTDPMALLGFAVILFPAVVTMWGIGLVVAGLTTLFKTANQAANIARVLMIAFGGIYIPIVLLPAWGQALSRILPVMYAGQGVRGALAERLHLPWMIGDLTILVGFAIVASTVGALVFTWLVDRARRAGSLYGY